MEKNYRFSPYFFAAFLVAAVFCFYRTYFGHIPDFEGIIHPINGKHVQVTNITHFHLMMLILWLLLLVAQPVLIVRKQLDWHRLLGKFSYFLVVLVIFSMLVVSYQEQTLSMNIDKLQANTLAIIDFSAMYAFAIYYRKKTPYHARFMLMNANTLMASAFARVMVEGFLVELAIWILFFVVEFFTKKIYKPYLIGFGFLLLDFAIQMYLYTAQRGLIEKIWNSIF